MFPNAIGSPGASVAGLGGKFGHEQASVGRDGEQRTARALNKYCKPGGPTVLHDLVLPMKGIQANIDHLVISGKEVRILDSKMWAPGFYWTFLGHTRRGFTRVDHADKQTMTMATTAINKWLSTTSTVRFTMKRPVLIIWPSSTRRGTRLGFYRPVGARAVSGKGLTLRHHRLVGTKPADQNLVGALLPLVLALRDRREVSRPAPTPRRVLPPPSSTDFLSDDF